MTFTVYLERPAIPKGMARNKAVEIIRKNNEEVISKFMKYVKESGLSDQLRSVSEPMSIPTFYFVGTQNLAKIAEKIEKVECVARGG